MASATAYVKAIEDDMRNGIFIRMDPSLKAALRREAEADERTLSAFIHKILTDWIKARPQPEGTS